MNSKPIKTFELANGKKVYVTFTHASEYRVMAEITADNVLGSLQLARDPTGHWPLLRDNMDRVVLFEGVIPHKLTIDVESIYQKYTMDQIVEPEDGVSSSKWIKTKLPKAKKPV